MKFSYDEKNELLKIVKKELNLLKMNQSTKEGNKKILLLESIIEKIKNSSLCGASLKQIKSLDGVARKKEFDSKNKIQNTINLFLLYGNSITVNSIAKESGMSYNTVKKYEHMLKPYKKEQKWK